MAAVASVFVVGVYVKEGLSGDMDCVGESDPELGEVDRVFSSGLLFGDHHVFELLCFVKEFGFVASEFCPYLRSVEWAEEAG